MMADYGALIALESGNPFITPQSTPFCLYRKVVVNSVANGAYHGASATVALDASYPAMVFCKTSDTAQPTTVGATRSGGNYYSGTWRLGAVRGAGTDLARVQMNIFDGVSSGADFRWYPYGAFQSKSHIGPGEGYGGGYQDIVNGYSTNTSFARPNLSTPNDSGFVPFGRWHTYCSGGYHAVTALGSISQGKSNWPSIELVTIGDSGSAGTRIFSFNTVTADISVSGSGGFGGNYIFSKQPNCDIELKHSVKYDDGYQSYENIKKFLPATYVYNDDPLERVRRGVIAQDVMKIDSEYVTLVPAAPKFDGEGNRVDADDTLALDSNVIMLDTVLALNYVIKQLEATQKELQELKQK